MTHPSAPIELRERLAVREAEVPRLLARLLDSEDIQEGMLISTCNRVEAYLVAKHAQRAAEEARRVLAQAGGVEEEVLKKHLYVKNRDEAVAHLFRVTASLDSMVVGEPQIGGQVKDAYTQAVACRSTGTYLNRLIHRALNVSKKIRTLTGIARHPVSVSYAAVLLAEKIFGDLEHRRVLLLGAGDMGALAARHLIERRVAEVRISNRTPEKAAELARSLGAEQVPFESVSERLEEIDIVITSTTSEGYILHEKQVVEAMKRRKNRPMFFIDISVPRCIDPAVHQIENVYLYDIDHLQGIIEANLKEREREAKKAEGIVADEVKAFVDTIGQMELSPTIHQLSKKFDLIRTQELEKYLAKQNGMTPQQKEAFEACTRAIVGKILHEPIILMKTEEARDGGPKYSEILKKLFKLEVD